MFSKNGSSSLTVTSQSLSPRTICLLVFIRFQEEKTKKKATQSITLPMKITLASIEVDGTKVTVYKTKTTQQVSTPVPAPAAGTIFDCDVPIEIL